MPVSTIRKIQAWLLVSAGVLAYMSSGGAEDLSSYGGAGLYHRFCAACHGAQGHGDGPVASDMSVMVPDVTLIAKRHGGAFPADDVRRIIDGRAVHMAHGTRAMPVWGYEFGLAGASNGQSAAELTGQLVEYLRSIQAK